MFGSIYGLLIRLQISLYKICIHSYLCLVEEVLWLNPSFGRHETLYHNIILNTVLIQIKYGTIREKITLLVVSDSGMPQSLNVISNTARSGFFLPDLQRNLRSTKRMRRRKKKAFYRATKHTLNVTSEF